MDVPVNRIPACEHDPFFGHLHVPRAENRKNRSHPGSKRVANGSLHFRLMITAPKQTCDTTPNFLQQTCLAVTLGCAIEPSEHPELPKRQIHAAERIAVRL